METMKYEDYVKRITTKGMRWRAVTESEDMRRYTRALATMHAAGRKIRPSDAKLDTKVMLTVESLPERPMEVPKLSDLPEELREIVGKIESKIGAKLAELAKKKLPPKLLAVRIHPEDLDREDPRMDLSDKFSADVIGRNLFLGVPENPDRWRMRHEDNRDAWVEFEFLGAIDLSGFEDAEPDKEASSIADELFKRLGNDGPVH